MIPSEPERSTRGRQPARDGTTVQPQPGGGQFVRSRLRLGYWTSRLYHGNRKGESRVTTTHYAYIALPSSEHREEIQDIVTQTSSRHRSGNTFTNRDLTLLDEIHTPAAYRPSHPPPQKRSGHRIESLPRTHLRSPGLVAVPKHRGPSPSSMLVPGPQKRPRPQITYTIPFPSVAIDTPTGYTLS